MIVLLHFLNYVGFSKQSQEVLFQYYLNLLKDNLKLSLYSQIISFCFFSYVFFIIIISLLNI